MVSDHFIPLESGGSVLLDEVLGGIAEVFPGDSAGDPMEEVPEKRPQSRSRNDEHLRGLSHSRAIWGFHSRLGVSPSELCRGNMWKKQPKTQQICQVCSRVLSSNQTCFHALGTHIHRNVLHVFLFCV